MTTTVAEESAARTTTAVTCIDPLADDRWDSFVRAHPASVVFHLSDWARVLVETYDYVPRYHVLEDAGGAITAAWPAMLIRSRITGTRLVTLPFSDFCPPLIRTDGDGKRLLDAVTSDAWAVNAKRIEARGWPLEAPIPPHLVAKASYVRHVIDLSAGHDAVRTRLSENVRRSLKKADGFGVTTRLGQTAADLEAFIRLNVRLRRKHGMLPQPSRFFQAIFRHFVETDRGYIALAEREGTPLAALLCLRHNGVTLDKYAVNDQSLNRFRGSHAVMWRAIETELERGTGRYDMGRSDGTAESLHRFKLQFGAETVPAPYYYHPAPGGMTTEDPKGAKKFALDAFARVAPEGLFLAAGRLAYRHLG